MEFFNFSNPIFPLKIWTHSLLISRERFGLLFVVTSYTKASFIGSVFRSSRPEVFTPSVLLKISQNSQKNTCAWVSFLIKFQADSFNFIKIETLALVFPCEFYQMHLVHRTHQVAAFEFFINTFQDN